VETMAKDLQASLEELITQADLRKKINKQQYISETIGEFTINDILKELEKPGRDPRNQIEEFRFDDTIKTIEDVKVGMTVPGLVTNVTNFGAFVDIGVKQDGLVHISQLSNTFVSDPNEVVKLQQKVMVTVTEVDVARKRIALTMKTVSGEKRVASGERKQTFGPSPTNKNIQQKEAPLNSFQAKLAELKKKLS
jgi:protein Tex